MKSKISVLGRILLCSVFALSVLGNRLPNLQELTDQLAGLGYSTPRGIIVSIAVVGLIGSMSVVLGFRARTGATLLLGLLMIATCALHPFWNFTGDQQRVEIVAFMQNLAIVGGLMFIMANGSGAGSLDLVLRQRPQPA